MSVDSVQFDGSLKPSLWCVRNNLMNTDNEESLYQLDRTLRLVARLIPLILVTIGITLTIERVRPLLTDALLTDGERRILLIIGSVYLTGTLIISWIVQRLFSGMADLTSLLVAQSEANARIAMILENQIAPTMSRIALGLDRVAQGGIGPIPDSKPGKTIAMEGITKAIEQERWDRAERLLQGFLRDFEGDPEAAVLETELREKRQEATVRLLAQLEAAKGARDPERVLDLRDQLTLHLRGDRLNEIDRSTIQWLIQLLQRKLRSGSIDQSVVGIAARAAQGFADLPEGASLMASLPTLRRAAGLCPRCAMPYRGLEDVCDECRVSA